MKLQDVILKAMAQGRRETAGLSGVPVQFRIWPNM